jgi:tRNA pseudouridine38-40 synthase
MQRLFLRISYDGTAYHGWQVQPNATTVQGVLDKALTTLLRENIESVGCGRTDTGVHARKFYLHFDLSSEFSDPQRLLHSLNGILPSDIAAHEFIAVDAQAHARFDATLRTYDYRVATSKDPFLVNRAWFHARPYDVDKMNAAAVLLLDHSEYGCFCKGKLEEQTTQCTVSKAVWNVQDGELVFTISANRFLRNMVRAIVGTLLEVGEETISLDDFREILHSGNRSEAGRSVPAHGLYLMDVRYPFIKP